MNEQPNNGSIILYQTEDGKSRIEVTLCNDTVWLTADQMAELFQRNKSTISRHIKNVFEDGELNPDSVVAFFATTAADNKKYQVTYYNLDMIISVGYRVKSHRGVQFRIWATQVLREYLVKGFAMNDDLLKRAGGGNYFDELLSRIRDIRSSEKVFYRKILEIYALSIDYDPRTETTMQFFKTVQNKMHFSVHGHTAAEIIYERANAEKDFMGLTSWTGALPKRTDAEIAKNYLSSDELDTLNRIVSLYLDFAELQAKSHKPMYMKDWIQKLDDFLKLSGKELLSHAGKISAELAKQKADTEYDKFKERTAYSLSPVEIHFLENFEKEQKKLKKQIQKQQIKRDYAKAKRSEQTVGTATKGTIDYIKKIGGKVTNFFKENRKVYISVAVLIGLMFLIITNVTSCSAVFLQNVITYTGTSYLSSDQAIREAELYYTQLEANLQERINNMESEEPGHEEYRYNIGPIEHDPFILISYLSAKYEEFTFEQVKPELDALFAEQYHLTTEAVNETVTETATVRVGESLGQVVTSGYCNCPICCGIWSGGPTASGVYPTANHTLAVDAYDPFVPIGTKVVMNGVEYTVEDTGAFARYGVQFDVYYDSHAAASAHGHQTWECYLADDNGSNEVEVTRTRDVDVLNVTLNSGNLMLICQDRLGFFQKELFSAYNDTKGNLQMFATPVDFNWYSSVTSYYGYRIHPISGANQLHNGMDIGAPEGTKVMAGLTGTVTTSAYNDSYGNYVVIKDSKGYELRYAHLSSRSVSAGASVTKGDEIGLVGNTGNSTGSHLHIELLKNGERLNPIFYLETGEGAGFGGNEYTSEAAQRLLNEAARYLGTPYVWGGYSPSGFDCSGFVSYCLTNSGVRNTGRLTAQGLYNICTPVSQSEAQPGDLIFFTGTYDAGEPVTHIGIYVGNGQMIHCGHPVQYTSINSPYWQSHFYGFGRW